MALLQFKKCRVKIALRIYIRMHRCQMTHMLTYAQYINTHLAVTCLMTIKYIKLKTVLRISGDLLAYLRDSCRLNVAYFEWNYVNNYFD